MQDKLTLGIQINPINPSLVFTLSTAKKYLILGMFLGLAGVFFGSITSIFWWYYHSSSIKYYSAQNTSLKKELLSALENQKKLLVEVKKINKMEEKLRIRYGLLGDDDFHNFGEGGKQSLLDMFYQMTNPLKQEISEIMNLIKAVDHNISLSTEHFKKLRSYLKYKSNIWNHTPTITPTRGSITSKYGYRTHPITGIWARHIGIDIRGKKWTPIYSTAAGKVIESKVSDSYGQIVVIDHGNGFHTKYAHLVKRALTKGKLVKRYDLVGYMGESGRTTGPHLHYEVHRDNVPLNPVNYILPNGTLVD